MLVEIAYRGAERAGNADAFDYSLQVLTWRDHDYVRTVVLRVADLTKVRLTRQLGKGDEKVGKPLYERALLLAGLRRLESLGAALLETPDVALLLKLDDSEIETVANERKHCDHQERRGTDLFCIAAERGTPGAGIPKDRKGSTTLHACETLCELPDTGLLCSNFVHLQVLMAAVYPPAPKVGPRICEAGYQKKVEMDPVACTPQGHDCWRRVLDLSTETREAPLPPLAFNEALDFLSWVWRAKFPTSQTKLIHLASSASAAEIGQACPSAEAFRSRMNALADLLDSVKIDANLTSAPDQIKGMLNRMQDVLRTQLPQPEFDRADAAIAVLRNIVDLRTGLHHTDAGRKAPAAARKLGVDWPPTDWARAWERVRDSAANATREIRQAIEVTM